MTTAYCLFVYCTMLNGNYKDCSTTYGIYEKYMSDKAIDELAKNKNSVTRSYCAKTEAEAKASDLYKEYGQRAKPR